jgi:hypothetical protein
MGKIEKTAILKIERPNKEIKNLGESFFLLFLNMAQ